MNCCYSTQNVFCFPLTCSSILMFRVVFCFYLSLLAHIFKSLEPNVLLLYMHLSYIHNVHPCLSSSKPFLLVLICLLKACCQTGRWLIGGQCFLHKSGSVSLLPETPSERRKLTLKVVLWLPHVSKACVHPYLHTDIMHTHTQR